MRTETRLEKYQEQLKNTPHPGRFNLYAFVFNSFYYLYAAMPGYFLLYFFGSLILMTASYAAVRSLWVIPLVMLGTRIVNAFSVDRIRLRHIRRFIERNQDVNYSRPVIFYPVPVKRLLISSVVSGGLYQIYWMYKNWQAVRRDTRDNQISPVVRGWLLGIFYIYPLLQTVRLNLQRSKTEGRHFTQLAVAYTACLFIQTGLCAAFYYGSARLPYLYAVWFALTTVWLTGLYLLITLQKRINFHNRKKNTKLQLQNGWHWGEAAVIAIGFLLSFGSLFWHRPQQQNDEKLGLALASTYRMTEGYAGFCRKQGYEMTRFPKVYNEYFRPEIEIINRRLKPYNLTMEQAWEFFRIKLNTVMDESIMREFSALKPAVIEQIIRQYKKEQIDNFDEGVAREFLEKEITLPVICSETDNNAEILIDNNEAYKKFFRETVSQIR